jgi:hypothetical protein
MKQYPMIGKTANAIGSPQCVVAKSDCRNHSMERQRSTQESQVSASPNIPCGPEMNSVNKTSPFGAIIHDKGITIRFVWSRVSPHAGGGNTTTWSAYSDW